MPEQKIGAAVGSPSWEESRMFELSESKGKWPAAGTDVCFSVRRVEDEEKWVGGKGLDITESFTIPA